MKQLEAKVRMAAIAALALVAAQAVAADVVKSLAGEWRVSGEGIEGVVRLPGTLADAKLGRHMTAADWMADTNRASKGALTREWQYRGKAVYEREIELTEEEARHPLELVMERVMLYSELAIDGEMVGSCDSLATEHVYPIPRRLTKPGRHTIRLTLDNSNRYNFSEWAHSYGPVMQSVWHGVVGEFALRRQSPLRKARVFASWPANGRLMVEVPEEVELKEGSVRLMRWTTSVRQQGISADEGQCCKAAGQQGGIATKQQGISAAEGQCCKAGCEAVSAPKPPPPSSQARSCRSMCARAAQRQEACCCPLNLGRSIIPASTRLLCATRRMTSLIRSASASAAFPPTTT